jgi:hypothetical protein
VGDAIDGQKRKEVGQVIARGSKSVEIPYVQKTEPMMDAEKTAEIDGILLIRPFAPGQLAPLGERDPVSTW